MAALVRQLPAQRFWNVEEEKLYHAGKRKTHSDRYGYALIDALPDIAVNPDMTAFGLKNRLLLKMVIWRLKSLLRALQRTERHDYRCWPGRDEDEAAAPTGQSQRLNAPCPSCGSRLLSGQKVISVQDVNLKSEELLWQGAFWQASRNLANKRITGELKGFVSSRTNKEFSAKLNCLIKQQEN